MCIYCVVWCVCVFSGMGETNKANGATCKQLVNQGEVNTRVLFSILASILKMLNYIKVENYQNQKMYLVLEIC